MFSKQALLGRMSGSKHFPVCIVHLELHGLVRERGGALVRLGTETDPAATLAFQLLQLWKLQACINIQVSGNMSN